MSIRPTSDKVREAVFNILPRDFPFRRVLDLYSGTGAMGIEALSRGAEEAVFVDKDPASIAVLRKNLDALGLGVHGVAQVIKRDVLDAIGLLGRGEKFDLIFIDPPYQAGLLDDTLKALDRAALLAPGGYIVAETSKRAPATIGLTGLELIDERKYGDTLVYFYRLTGC